MEWYAVAFIVAFFAVQLVDTVLQYDFASYPPQNPRPMQTQSTKFVPFTDDHNDYPG